MSEYFSAKFKIGDSTFHLVKSVDDDVFCVSDSFHACLYFLDAVLINEIIYNIVNCIDSAHYDQHYNEFFITRYYAFNTDIYIKVSKTEYLELTKKEALFLFEYFWYLITHD